MLRVIFALAGIGCGVYGYTAGWSWLAVIAAAIGPLAINHVIAWNEKRHVLNKNAAFLREVRSHWRVDDKASSAHQPNAE